MAGDTIAGEVEGTGWGGEASREGGGEGVGEGGETKVVGDTSGDPLGSNLQVGDEDDSKGKEQHDSGSLWLKAI